MSETCERTGRYNLTACGETATHTVSLDGAKFQDMCLRHASKYVGFGYQVEKIKKPELIFNYADAARTRLNAALPGLDPELAKLYALLVLVKGTEVTLKDVHDAWAIWRNETNPNHKSLVPFEELSAEVQALDTKYAEGICVAATE